MWEKHRKVVLAALPVSRADMELLTSYRQQDDTPVSCPIVAAGCSRDRPSNSEANVRAWHKCTTGAFEFQLFDGNHFVFTESPTQHMLPWLGQHLQKLLQ